MVGRRDGVPVFNRATGCLETETVVGERWLRLLYGTGLGRLLADRVLARAWFGRSAGRLQDSPRSARRVPGFIRRYGIAMDEFEVERWASFNHFFIRRFRPGARSFVAESDRMPAFCEARYLAFERVDRDVEYPVKGRHLAGRTILGDPDLAATFAGGPLLIARLAPVDYHRFHFPDAGEPIAERHIAGGLHSVNPIALRRRPDALAANDRFVSILATDNFGLLAYVEVGAMNVGKIVHTHPRGAPFARGDEKGYFCFGASTVLLFGQNGRWLPLGDLLDRTTSGVESLVRLGEPVACAV